MSFLSPSPPPASPPPPPPPPLPPEPVTREEPEVKETRRKVRRAARLRKGRAATILTSGTGVSGPAPVTRKRLLGE